MNKTKLIRVSNEFTNFLDNDVKNFIEKFNLNNKKIKITRTKSADLLRDIFKNSEIYFLNDSLLLKDKNYRRKFEFAYKKRL